MQTLSTPTSIVTTGLPSIIITLFREEIKNYSFLKRLEDAGFDTSFHTVDLSTSILALMGFGEADDELMEWYWRKLEYYCEEYENKDHRDLSELAFNFYIELEVKKRSTIPAIVEGPGEV